MAGLRVGQTFGVLLPPRFGIHSCPQVPGTQPPYVTQALIITNYAKHKPWKTFLFQKN